MIPKIKTQHTPHNQAEENLTTLGQLIDPSKIVSSNTQPDFINTKLHAINILGLSSDSRHACKGDLFFALQGHASHGLDFIEALIERQVAAIVYSPPDNLDIPEKKYDLNALFAQLKTANIPIFEMQPKDLHWQSIALNFYKNTLETLKIIGITGTEGKTSVAQFIAQALELNQQPCGYIGTNGIGRLAPFGNEALRENTHTTPDLLSLLHALHELSVLLNATKDSPKYVALEVTSHALDQERIRGITFEAVIFLNLNRDHLDYHKTLEAYGQAKAKLFTDYCSKHKIINQDDNFVRQHLLPQIATPYVRFGTQNSDFQISNLTLKPEGLHFQLTQKNHNQDHQTQHIQTGLYGHFMASNLAATAATLCQLSLPFAKICSTLPQLFTVTGRMQKVIWPLNLINQTRMPPTVIIDYAHKPNALLQALLALRQHTHSGRLMCVFGCGGDRDKGKRPLMGSIAVEHADVVIITSDNPRTEEQNDILQDILAGISPHAAAKIHIENHRKKAIHLALSMARSDDIILIAGKGHETYQIIGHTKSHFDDYEIVLNYYVS